MIQDPKDYRDEIPKLAFINAQIIQQIFPSKDFEVARQNVISLYKNQGLSEYQFNNPAYIASLLYCLIVVPKEIWAQSETSSVYRDIDQLEPCKLFDINKRPENDTSSPTFSLIRHLRNSIAHANFSVDKAMRFEFRDRPSEKEEPDWVVSINAVNMMKFLSKVGGALANAQP